MTTCEIIIPSYNRLGRLFETVRALIRLYPDVPICLAIQGEAPSPEQAAFLDSAPNIRWELLEKPGVVPAINKSVFESQADIFILLDDDAVPCEGWLEAHLEAMSDPDVAYTTGREVNTNRGRSPLSEFLRIVSEQTLGLFVPKASRINGRIIGWTTRFGLIFANYNMPGDARINSPMECNLAMRTEEFKRLGGFDTRFRGNAWGYGARLGLQCANKGRYGRYVGNAVVLHHEHQSGGSRARKGLAWYRDFLHNNRVVIEQVGPTGWLGAVPRLTKRYFQAVGGLS